MRLKVIFKHCEVASLFGRNNHPIVRDSRRVLSLQFEGHQEKITRKPLSSSLVCLFIYNMFCFDFSSHSYYFKSCVIFLLLTIWRCVQNTLFFLKNKQGHK